MRVFITGGNGYIGRAVVEALVAEGHEVEALVREGADASAVSDIGGVLEYLADSAVPA